MLIVEVSGDLLTILSREAVSAFECMCGTVTSRRNWFSFLSRNFPCSYVLARLDFSSPVGRDAPHSRGHLRPQPRPAPPEIIGSCAEPYLKFKYLTLIGAGPRMKCRLTFRPRHGLAAGDGLVWEGFSSALKFSKLRPSSGCSVVAPAPPAATAM